ncbi:MAG TPA: hypothetical protein VN617_10060 [Rhodoferax sp.]|nr:hypothetical protein [Rhodoferax sp.]
MPERLVTWHHSEREKVGTFTDEVSRFIDSPFRPRGHWQRGNTLKKTKCAFRYAQRQAQQPYRPRDTSKEARLIEFGNPPAHSFAMRHTRPFGFAF